MTLPSPSSRLTLIASALLAACAERNLPAPPGPLPADLEVGPDLVGASLHVTWSLLHHDRQADCAAAGVASVGIRLWQEVGPFITWPCTSGEGRTAIPLQQGGAVALAIDGAGVPLDYHFLNQLHWYQPGAHELVATFHVSGEPVPQLRELFEKVVAWYGSHANSFPPAADWTPSGPGICCAPMNQICPVDPKVWASPPWASLDFSIGHSFRFSYSFTPSAGPPASFVVRAAADLNCNGKTSAYHLTGTWIGSEFVGKDDLSVSNAGE